MDELKHRVLGGVMVVAVLVGAFFGMASAWLPWPVAAGVGSASGFICGFVAMVAVDAFYRSRIERIVMRRVGSVLSEAISSTCRMVGGKVAGRMVAEMFHNIGSDEHREAALERGARIVNEEVDGFMRMIEDMETPFDGSLCEDDGKEEDT